MKITHTAEQLLSNFVEKEKRILQLSGDPSLKELVNPSEFVHLPLSDLNDLEKIPKGFDYIVVTDALEYLEDPVNFITYIKNIAKNCVIFEFKYDDPEWVLDPAWKKPWATIGLENILTQNFDYLNSIFLQHATIHICNTPFNKEEEEYGPK